jgi:hypothetical protein
MKKYAYATNGCELCGLTVHAHEQEILALVDRNRFVYEALYICPACKSAANAVIERKAKKLNTETYVISISANGGKNSGTVLTQKLQHLLKDDLNALSVIGLCRSAKARALLNRLQSRLRDLQIIQLGYYSVGDRWSQTSEAVFTARDLDTGLKLSMLKKILSVPVCHGRMCYEVAVVSAFFTEPPISYPNLPVPGDAVAISLQLANLINCHGVGVIDVAMKLQTKGLSAFKSIEQCVHIFETLNFSMATAEAYAESYTAVRKQLKL